MVKKICIFIFIIALIVSVMPIKSYALSIFDPIINYKDLDPGASEHSVELEKIANSVVNVIYAIGIFLSVGILMVIGIKYMVGSLEEKAQYKETLMPFLIGAVLLFGGVNIIKIIYDFVQRTL